MNKIQFSVGQAADVAVMPPNADATMNNATGGSSVFAGIVISKRGKPNTVIQVSSDSLKKRLGDPIHPYEGANFEPYRHVYQALNGGNGYVVRVEAEGMKLPMLSAVQTAAENADPVISLQATNHSFGTDLEPPDNAAFSIYVDDGDSSLNRVLSIIKDEDDSAMYTLLLKETNIMGEKTTLESIPVSFKQDALNDMGQPAFLPIALENNSSYLRALIGDLSLLPDDYSGFADEKFQGGSDGDMIGITEEAYANAINALSGSMVNYTAILSLGCYNQSALNLLVKLANDVRVDAFIDIHPALRPAKAVEEAKEQGWGSYAHICRYHFPYSCRDEFSGAQVVFGLSGDAFTAKAKGVATVPDIGGYHLSPAGQGRGTLMRSNIKALAGAAEIDREVYATVGINPVSCASDGSVMIDDALTTYSRKNYLRYQHVNSIFNSVARQFYVIAQALKHEPDGVTRSGFERELPRLLDRYVACGALVPPRDPSQGTMPYKVDVKQDEFDMWRITYSLCPTGSSRRIVGEPVLIP